MQFNNARISNFVQYGISSGHIIYHIYLSLLRWPLSAKHSLNSDKFSSVRAGPHSELDAMYLALLTRKSTYVTGNGRLGESACAHVRRCKDENGPHGANSCLG